MRPDPQPLRVIKSEPEPQHFSFKTKAVNYKGVLFRNFFFTKTCYASAGRSFSVTSRQIWQIEQPIGVSIATNILLQIFFCNGGLVAEFFATTVLFRILFFCNEGDVAVFFAKQGGNPRGGGVSQMMVMQRLKQCEAAN